MEEKNIFPRDPDTFTILKEMEAYLGVMNKNIMEMERWELHMYIDKLTLLMINENNKV